MKTIILAGGLGTRISELTYNIPKPMIEIGGKPILWHIMNIYSQYGYKDFLVALGYKGDVIKRYFLEVSLIRGDLSLNLSNGEKTIYRRETPDWSIDLIDTGLDTQTGGRIKKLKEWIGDETFMVTYGDGLSNVNIEKLIDFHKEHKKIATLTAVHPVARFGEIVLNGTSVQEFAEKKQAKNVWINGGFFVLEPEVFDYIEGDLTSFEKEPLENLATDGELKAYLHEGFWQPMDTLKEQRYLDSLCSSGETIPWKILEAGKST